MATKNHIDASNLYKLALEANRFKSIDESINFLIQELIKLFLLENACLETNQYPDSLKDSVLLEESKIYIPLNIKNRLCAAIGLIFKDNTDAITLHASQKEHLETFAQLISQMISLNQTINDLKTSNQTLLNQDRLKSQLISTISHELRTPMANIMGFSELLLNKDYEQKTRLQYTQEIYNASIRLSQLINNFLDLSRIENNGELMLNNFEEVELDWLAERAWSHLGAINQKHQIRWHIENKIPEVFVDSEAITRVFVNLFANAIKYSPCLGTETKPIDCFIGYKNNNNEILVSIKDSGIGITEEHLDSVFEKFYRIENQNTKHISGTGLGLWISKEILEAHGGRIWCESKAEEGSCFNFTLPLGVKENVTKILLY
jgi:signal transduction histidine kinase